MKQHIDKIEEIIDKEINLYREMEQVVTDKKQVIIKGDMEALKDVDTKLIEQASLVASLAQARQKECIPLGRINFTFEEIAKKAYEYDKQQSERLFEKRTLLKKITKDIQKINNINANLIKHSLTIMEKTMGIIVSTVMPEADSYNKSGRKNKLNENYKMSSISTEA